MLLTGSSPRLPPLFPLQSRTTYLGWHHPQWAPSSQSSVKDRFHRPASGQPEGGLPSVKVPFSQVTLVCISVIKANRHTLIISHPPLKSSVHIQPLITTLLFIHVSIYLCNTHFPSPIHLSTRSSALFSTASPYFTPS